MADPLVVPAVQVLDGAVSKDHHPVSARDRALDGGHGAAAVRGFLRLDGPAAVAASLPACLPVGCAVGELRLVRAKLKPGRKLVASYAVRVLCAGGATERALAVSWVAPGTALPAPAPELEAAALRSGALKPFQRAWHASADARMSIQVSPVDAAVPQLVRWHDPDHVAAALAAAGFDARPGEVTVVTVRFRPGQRHILRVSRGGGLPDVYAKVYRDEAGRAAVTAARRVEARFRASGAAASAGPGTFLAQDRTTLWPEVTGRLLSDVVATAGAAAGCAVEATGAALRALHTGATRPGDPPAKDATAQVAETIRASQVIDALLPSVGRTVRRLAALAASRLAALPDSPVTPVHGDYKGDNILVRTAAGGSTAVHVLDFDGFGAGDPAADVGKLRADLRWCSRGDGATAAALRAALDIGYGAAGPAQSARAEVYDGLFQLRLAARRARVQDEGWERRVVEAVESAAATLARHSAGR